MHYNNAARLKKASSSDLIVILNTIKSCQNKEYITKVMAINIEML